MPIRRSSSGLSWRATIAHPSRPPIASSIRPIRITQSIALELRDVGAERTEGQAPDRGPLAVALLQRRGDLARVFDGRPDEDGRARPRDRRAEGAELAGLPD